MDSWKIRGIRSRDVRARRSAKGGKGRGRYELPDLTIELNERRSLAIAGQGFKFQLHHHNDVGAA
jgi:hypothetical protein